MIQVMPTVVSCSPKEQICPLGHAWTQRQMRTMKAANSNLDELLEHRGAFWVVLKDFPNALGEVDLLPKGLKCLHGAKKILFLFYTHDTRCFTHSIVFQPTLAQVGTRTRSFQR